MQEKYKNTKKNLRFVILFFGFFLLFSPFSIHFLPFNYQKVFAHAGQVGNAVGGANTSVSEVASVREGKEVTMGLSWVTSPFLNALFIILLAIGNLIALVAKLITFSLSDTMMSIYNSPGLYTGWVTVRDFLNIFFIFFLIFSAFSTIFQVSKYHIRSTWVMIVVMALLVNFSWPITRIMIDVSNVTMSYIIGQTDGDTVAKGGLIARLSDEVDFVEMMIGEDYFKNNTSTEITKSGGLGVALIIGILIGMIFLFTIGAVGILLLIRVISLAVLLVFSPAGFVFSAFPSTRGTANQWWDKLLNQVYLGPVVLFSLLLAINVMDSMSNEFSNTAAHAGLMGAFQSLPKFAVAIILIWSGIIAAQKISGETANMSLKVARKARGYTWRGTKAGTKGFVAGTDRIAAWGVNKASNMQGDGRVAQTVRGVGTGLSVARALPSRVKNFADEKKKSGNAALEEAKTRGVAAGTKIGTSANSGRIAKIAGGVTRFGQDAGAIEDLKTKNVNKIKDDQKNTSTTTLVNGLEEAKGDKLVATLQTLAKRDDFADGEMEKLVKALNTLDTHLMGDTKRQKASEKIIMKKAMETGNGHVVVQNTSKTARDVFGGVEPAVLAKQKVFKEYADNPNFNGGDDIMRTINQRFNGYSPKNREVFADTMNLDQIDNHAAAIQAAQSRGVI